MKKYELMYIVKPHLEEDARNTLIENLHAILTNNEATIENVDEWGLRDLAYEIDHITKGYYVVVTFTSDERAINEFDRLTRINRDVIRHMIVNLDDHI